MKPTMMAMSIATICAAPALATREPTVPPVYYLIDYGQGHLDNPEYVAWIAQLPPDLLHFGKDVPMTHLYGPIAAVGGENQAHGRNRDDIRRLTPAEVVERMAALRRMTDALHAAGVRMVMPYTASITYAGDPDTREGIFDFYDHWEEYAQFGLGPRPASDPVEWMAVKADGSPHTFGPDLKPAYYAGLSRYIASVEHPDWRRWLQHVQRLVAEVGYDGAFPDNTSPIADYSPFALAAWHEYLAERFTPAQIRELFGVERADQVALPTERGGIAWVEAQRFWRVSIARHAEALRAGGRQANPDFLLFPNLGGATHLADYLPGKVDYYMSEGGAGLDGAGCTVARIIGEVFYREVHDNIVEYVYGRDVPGDLRTMLLKLGPSDGSRKLALAEAAAFGSGAYNGVRPNSRDTQAPYIRFLREHAGLYDGKVSLARVAMPFFPMRDFYGSRHSGTMRQVFLHLGELQVPCDLFSESGFDAQVLATYDLLIVPHMDYLSDAHLAIIEGFARAGGTVLTVGDFATHDELMRPRAGVAWLPLAGGETTLGDGLVIRRELMPTTSELVDLLTRVGETRLVVEGGRAERTLLRSSAYADADEVIVHLLNYSVPIEAGPEVVPQREVRVRAPLPEGASVAGVTLLTPEADEMTVDYEVRDGACWFTVPEVAIYVVARVELG